MTQHAFDAIIIGGRIAGVMIGGLLARAGFNVLIVEQARLPRDTISAPVLYGNALQMLDIIGANTAIDRCGFPKIRRIRKISGAGTLTGYLLPIGGRDYAYGVTRERLDKALLDHVRQMDGVTVREGFTVRRLLWDHDRVVGIEGYQDRHSECREQFSADITIGADGIKSFTARQVKSATYRSDPPTHCQYYAFFRNFEALDEPEMMVNTAAPDHTLLTFDVAENLLAISWAPRVQHFATIRSNIPAAFTAAWQAVPELRERGKHAERVTKLLGRLPTPSYFRQPWGAGWALVGDAAFYTDPSGGRGFYDALRSAELLAHAFTQYRRGRPWNEAMHVFHTARDYEYDASYRYIRQMADTNGSLAPDIQHMLSSVASDRGMLEIWLSFNKAVDIAPVVGPPQLPMQINGREVDLSC